ncbi:MAG: GIY-YIG nuclease family protein [Clostridia bacterium]|nr:GIY-YIG nuclease family protein [Clostridia bacterium]
MLIYKITNKINNKNYIGQTTRSLEDRKKDYVKEVRFSKADRPIIRAMRKYGIENFEFEILKDNVETQDELDILEIQYIKKYNTQVDVGDGYNLKYGGQGGKHAEETKRKIGEAQLGEKNHMYGKTGALNPSSIKVIELTTGERFDSAMLAASNFNVNFSHVCAVCRGERGSTGGYVFRYLDKQDNPIKPEKTANIKFRKVKDNIKKEFEHLL